MITRTSERRSRPAVAPNSTSNRTRAGKIRRRAVSLGTGAVSAAPSRLSSTGGGALQSGGPFPIPAWKRLVDIAIILATLPVSIPLVVIVALWIRLVSRGPALFRQERIGIDGKPFTLYKFRSMFHGAPTVDHEQHMERLVELDRPLVKLDLLGDARLVPGGCFLRTSGLDELPQLLNVLLGEMSLVGPRPCLPGEYALFDSTQRARFTVLPGLTGLWQVSGKNQTTFKEMNAMDADYARLASPLFDLKIMVRTPMALFRQMGECMAHHRKRSRAKTAEPLLGYATQRLGDRS
jgi:lipopolysaccharide/colanic/teichoic acid biosynthesis glycosyltransferase